MRQHKLLFCSMMLFAATLQAGNPDRVSPQSLRPQTGPMSLAENYRLADKFPAPSAWLLANSCSACHGTNGAEFDTLIPPLAGIKKQVFIALMKAYQSDLTARSTPMAIIAEPFTEREIEAMADFFSRQKGIEWTHRDWNEDVTLPAWSVQQKTGG